MGKGESPKFHILLVEDNPGDRDLILAHLEDTSDVWRVETAASLAEALEKSGQGHFDAMLLDLGLPDSLGLDTLIRLRARAEEVPIIVLTGMDDEKAGIEAIQNGAQDYLVKGQTHFGLLMKFLRHAMERHSLRARVEHYNRVLKAIRNVNQLIVREREPAKIIRQTCDLLVETRSYNGAWIALGDGVNPPLDIASSGWGERFDPLSAELRRGNWPPCCARALVSGESVFIADPDAACDCPLAGISGHNVGGVCVFSHEDRVYGVLAVSIGQASIMDEEEASLLDEVGGDIAFALHKQELTRTKKDAEARLEKSEGLLDFALDQMPIPVIIADAPDVKISRYNAPALDLLAQHPEDVRDILLGEHRDYWPTFYPDGRPYAVEDLPLTQAVKEGKTTVNREIIVRHPDADRWISASAAPLKDEKGNIIAGIVVFPEITEEKRLTEQLQATANSLHMALKSANIGLFDWNMRTGQIYFSPEWKAQIGYLDHEIESSFEEWETRVHPEDRANVLETLNSYLDGRLANYSVEFRFLHKDGSYRQIVAMGDALRDERGKPFRMSGCHLDVTDHRAAEAEKHRLEEQFRQSQKMESVGRLAGGVAHDLNNLLTPIIGYGEILLEEFPQNDDNRESAQEIYEAALKAKDLVRQLLAFSRKQPLDVKKIQLNDVVQRFEKLLRRTLRENIDIEFDLTPDIKTILGDVGQVEQVLMNLAVNAQDAMPFGGKLTIETGTVELDGHYAATHPESAVGRHAMLAVSDSGQGMAPEVQERVFEPFFTTKEKGKGTGLGLATVFGIVKQHGGNIYVYSEPGRGTTFKIYFPVSEVEGKAREVSQKKAPDRVRGNESVMVVEDDDRVRKLAVRILEKHGYRVFLAESGEDCLSAVAEHKGHLDLLLTDVVMPGMSGKSLFTAVKERFPDLKVLYMSGYTDNAIVHHGVLDEGTAFIQKPFSISGLVAKVREVLDTL